MAGWLRWLRRTAGEEKGQAIMEFFFVFPALVLLFVLIGGAFWFWWNQSVASVAIHVGTAEAARSRSLAAGHEAFWDLLAAGTGRYALTYEGDYGIVVDPATRSVKGWVAHPMRLFGTVGYVRSGAFHRFETFWPGPPSYWW